MTYTMRFPKKPKPAGPRKHHPTSSDIDYSDEEFEFLKAIEKFKHEHHTKFPTWREAFQVMKGLGYTRIEGDGCQSPNELKN